jgi:hypothetical protein
MDHDRDIHRFRGGGPAFPIPDRHTGEIGLLAWRTMVGKFNSQADQKN